MNEDKITEHKAQARAWFEALRDRIVAALEAIEDELSATAPLADRPAGNGRDTVVVAGGGFTGIEAATEMPARLRDPSTPMSLTIELYHSSRVVWPWFISFWY